MPRRLLPALAALVLAGCDTASEPSSVPAAGVNLTAYSAGGYSSPESGIALERLDRIGVRDVAVVAHWYMDRRESSALGPVAGKTPTDASLLDVIARLRARGVRVLLKPHVDVMDGTFRGEIAPADVAAWFASYTRFITHFADVAREGGAQGLVVGTELTSMAGHTGAWRGIVGQVRSRFAGPLTFAANWFPGPQAIGFWDALDCIGIDAYVPLGREPRPPLDRLLEAWRPHVDEWTAFAARQGKPLVLTELGYRSARGAAQQIDGIADQEAQATAYRAAVQAWRGRAQAIYWWDWDAEGRNAATGDTSFRPAGKLAEGVIGAQVVEASGSP